MSKSNKAVSTYKSMLPFWSRLRWLDMDAYNSLEDMIAVLYWDRKLVSVPREYVSLSFSNSFICNFEKICETHACKMDEKEHLENFGINFALRPYFIKEHMNEEDKEIAKTMLSQLEDPIGLELSKQNILANEAIRELNFVKDSDSSFLSETKSE